MIVKRPGILNISARLCDHCFMESSEFTSFRFEKLSRFSDMFIVLNYG